MGGRRVHARRMANLAMVLTDLERLDEAEELLRLSFDKVHGVKQKEPWRVPNLHGKRGRLRLKQGRLQEAEQDLLIAFEALEAYFGPDHARVQRVRADLAACREQAADTRIRD